MTTTIGFTFEDAELVTLWAMQHDWCETASAEPVPFLGTRYQVAVSLARPDALQDELAGGHVMPAEVNTLRGVAIFDNFRNLREWAGY